MDIKKLMKLLGIKVNKVVSFGRANINLLLGKKSGDGFNIGGRFGVNCYDKNGTLKWAEYGHNIWVNSGRNYILNTTFKNSTSADPLYAGLVVTTVPNATWSMANAAFTEFTGYNDNRKEFVDGAIGSFRINNSGSKATFTVSAAGTVRGAFLVNTATVKGTTNGIMLCADDFTTPRAVVAADKIELTYTVGVDDDGV